MNRLTDAELEAMAGHTDGPWDVDNYGDIHVNGLDIAMPMIGFGDEMDAANSALLVAAPAMYAELLERRAMDAVVREALELVEAGNRVTKAFRALGEVEFPREKYNARFECEQSMIALDAALAPYREKADAAE